MYGLVNDVGVLIHIDDVEKFSGLALLLSHSALLLGHDALVQCDVLLGVEP